MRRLVHRIRLAYALLREYEREQAEPPVNMRDAIDTIVRVAATLPNRNGEGVVAWKDATAARLGLYAEGDDSA